MAHLILASSSPRRQELLAQMGLTFEVCSPDIDETPQINEPVEHYVKRMAQEKAQVVLSAHADAIVLAADTSLSLDGQIIGKPESKQHAFEIWSMLSGRYHDVFSGICAATSQAIYSEVVQTRVAFQTLRLSDMEYYWQTGEPLGKAGAYAIQGMAAQFIPRIEGSYTNVVGLPVYETIQLLKRVKAIEDTQGFKIE